MKNKEIRSRGDKKIARKDTEHSLMAFKASDAIPPLTKESSIITKCIP